MKEENKLFIIMILILFVSIGLLSMWEYFNEVICEQIPPEPIEIELVEIGEGLYTPKHKIMIVTYNNTTWEDVKLPFEEIKNDSIRQLVKNITNITEHFKMYDYIEPREAVTYTFEIQSHEIVCRKRIDILLEEWGYE